MASILFSTCFLIYVIRNQFSNHPSTYNNKIANELSAHISEINDILIIKIKKNKAHDESITMKIKRLLTNIYKKLRVEINSKITNELSTYLYF